jgi:protein O-GlcNAc transferase
LSTSQLDNAGLVEQIRQDGIDILVDLAGHTTGNRLLAFARKPAPIQITAWGYPHGTKMDAIDYLFADPIFIPLSERNKYIEEIIDLPCVIHLNSGIGFPEIKSPPVCKAGHITFGAFNRIEKYSNSVYTAWAEILHRVPTAKLLIKSKSLNSLDNINILQTIFQDKGISPKRIIFMGSSPKQDHLKSHEKIDIMLDPYPHNGGMTTLESLRMGVPVLTCEKMTRCPTSASILHVMGLDEWRAGDEKDYIEKAVEFANDIPTLRNLRKQLRSRFDESVLGNSQLYVSKVEAIYRKLWQKWCRDNIILGSAPTTAEPRIM